MRTSPTKLLIIDSIAQHDEEADGQLPCHRHFGQRHPFAKGQATIRPAQSGVVPAGGLCGFDQQPAQQAIALFGQVPEALSSRAGIFLRNQPQVTGQVAPT